MNFNNFSNPKTSGYFIIQNIKIAFLKVTQVLILIIKIDTKLHRLILEILSMNPMMVPIIKTNI